MTSFCSFNRSSERQYSLRAPDALSEPIVMVDLDTSNGVMFPLYDPDTNLIFLCGKGDSVIRYFEITPEQPFVHYINTFQTPDPQRGIGETSVDNFNESQSIIICLSLF